MPSGLLLFPAYFRSVIMNDESRLRSQIIDQLTGEHAHISLAKAVKGLSFEETGIIPQHGAHSIWMLVEHIRRAQYDILDFSRNPDYEMHSWPDDYWLADPAPKNQSAWDKALAAITKDREAMVELINDPDNDLLAPIPHGDGQTLFREAMLIVDHNSYHIGQIVQVRRLLGSW